MTAPTAGYGLRRNATQLKHRDSDRQHVVLRKHQDFRFQSALEGVVLCLRGLASTIYLLFLSSIVQPKTVWDLQPLTI